MRRLAVGACGLLVLIGCSSDGSTDTTTAGEVTTTRLQAVSGESYAVDSLGLTFELPEPFLSYIDNSYVFSAVGRFRSVRGSDARPLNSIRVTAATSEAPAR